MNNPIIIVFSIVELNIEVIKTMDKLNSYKVKDSLTIKEAMSLVNSNGVGFCVCVDKGDKVIGVLTDGDFRRAILNGVHLGDNIRSIANNEFVSLSEIYTQEDIKKLFMNTVAKIIPIIDSNDFLVDIINKENFFGIEKLKGNNMEFPYPVVVMAGGEGLRLAPFTKILPKPLLPIGDEPIIKVIMDKFNKYGANQFFVTVNSKKQMIK